MRLPSKISGIRHKINSYLQERLDQLGCKGLVTSHGEILFRLFNYGPLTMSQMAKAIKRDPSTVTTLVNKLRNNGFIELIENKQDMRSKLITLTNKGEAFEKEFTKISHDLNICLLNNFSKDEKKQLMSLLDKIENNLDIKLG